MAIETVSDLIKRFREDERDMVEPYFWSNAQLVRFANQALTVFAERTKSFYDDESAVTSQVFAAGEDRLSFPACIIDVLEAQMSYGGKLYAIDVIAPGTMRKCCMPTSGRPVAIVANTSSQSMRLVPPPPQDGSIQMTVIRRPLQELDRDSCIPDIKQGHREHLLLYMKHRAYSVADSEVFDPAKSRSYQAEFFGECQSVYEDELRRRGGARQIRYNG